jgi:hypothetical protein
VRGAAPEDRLAARKTHSTPIIEALKPWLEKQNALFAGHEVGAENWALLASIVATCKLNDVDPVAYIAETLSAIRRAASNRSCVSVVIRPRL